MHRMPLLAALHSLRAIHGISTDRASEYSLTHACVLAVHWLRLVEVQVVVACH